MTDEVQSVEFTSHQPPPKYGPSGMPGVEVTEKFRELLQRAADGTLPELGEIPEHSEDVQRLAAELAVVHLPEWRNPAGRKLADPAVTKVPSAIRIAEYLVLRGYRWHPEDEAIRWAPTPGGQPGPFDLGLHIRPDENGQWPDPDPEQFWDISDIKVEQLDTGMWAAAHPRGIAYEAKTKSEAYAGLVGRIRTKIEEASKK